MNFFKRFKLAFKTTLGDFSRNMRFGMMSARSQSRPSIEDDPYGSLVGWAYYALDKIAQRISTIELELYQLKSNGDVEEIVDHEILSVLYRPNPSMTKTDLFYYTALIMKIWGEAPWYIERNNYGKILNIWPLRPDLLRTTQSRENGQVISYEYSVLGKVQSFSPSDIMYPRKLNPNNPLGGKSPLFASALEIDADLASAIWNRHIIENGAEPGGVLTSPDELSDDVFGRLKERWESRHGGPTNAGRTAILEAGIKYEKISQTQKELDFIESRKFNRDTILTQLGVPTSLINDTANRANAETAERVFAKDTIDPMERLITEQISEFVLPTIDDALWLTYESPIKEDRESLRADYTAGVDKWLTVNEVRASENLTPLEGGDVLYRPFSEVATIGTGIDNTPTDVAPVKGMIAFKVKQDSGYLSKKHLGIKKAVLARTYKKRAVINFVTKSVTKAIAEIMESKGSTKVQLKINGKVVGAKKKFAEDGSDLPLPVMHERKAYITKLPKKIKRFKTKMQGFFSDLEVEVKKNLETAGEPKGILGAEYKEEKAKPWLDKVIFDKNKNIKVLLELTNPDYQDNISEGGKDVATLMGKPFAELVAKPSVVNFLADKPMKFSVFILDTTIEDLRTTLSAGLAEGEGLGQLGDRISEVFDMARGFRSETIARTEVGSALNFGRNEEMSLQGVEKKQWLSIFSNSRDSHMEAHGQIVNTDESFEVDGESLEYPQDPEGDPANIINCQCSASPYFSK